MNVTFTVGQSKSPKFTHPIPRVPLQSSLVRKLIIEVLVVSGDLAPQVASLLWQRNCSEDFKSKVQHSTSGEVIMWFTESVSGFIAPRNNDDGIVLPNPKHGKDNRSKAKQQRAVRQKYTFVKASKRGQRHRDYFNPNSAVQLRVMGMEDTVVRTLSQPTERRHPLFILWLVTARPRYEPLLICI